MAIQLALICFEFESIKGLKYDPEYDHDFGRNNSPGSFEGIQPIVRKAFKRIRKCVARTVSSELQFGYTKLHNHNNVLHIGTISLSFDLQNPDATRGQKTVTLTMKFYRLDPEPRYKVCIDIEEMPTSSLNNRAAFKYGMRNCDVEMLADELDRKFYLNSAIEYMPLMRRGRLEVPHFLVTSDQRILEYDFNKILFHRKNRYQDIKIVSSPSLGNTLLLDNLQNLSEVDIYYTYTLMDRGIVSYKDKEVLILGGGDGGLLYELLKEEPKMVTMAEIDADVLEACAEHMAPFGEILKSFEGPRHKILVKDCIEVLKDSIAVGKKYDAILNDLTDLPLGDCRPARPTDHKINLHGDYDEATWKFIEEILQLSLECLAEDGFYMNHATGKGNRAAIKAYESLLKRSPIPVTFDTRFSFVPSFMEPWLFYTVRKVQKEEAEGEGAMNS